MMQIFFPVVKQPKPKPWFEKLIIKYLHPIMVVNVYIQNISVIRPDIPETVLV